MSDEDSGSAAWRVSPALYLCGRPAIYSRPDRPSSCYVAMRDGCRLAVDVHRPVGGPARVPTILFLTPYYRRFALKPGSSGSAEDCPGAGRFRDFFVPRGYALVVVDVRGTGASFGTRDGFRSPREREDFREIADWVVAQPWSDGTIGATGISYVGAACDFLASTGHKAVRAIAPLFAVWDTYADHYYPGGMLLNRLAENYDRLMVAMDHDRREMLGEFAYYRDARLSGPQPVDEDADGSLRDAAVREHRGNFRMPDFIGEFRFREEPLPYDATYSSAAFSPYHYAAGVPDDVAVYSVSGWMDGAGYANGAIARFLTLPNPRRHLLLGPWDHGARTNVSPWRSETAPRFTLFGELLRFFDHYLAGMATGLDQESPIHYFTMHQEIWQEAASWPPMDPAWQLNLHEAALSPEAAPEGADLHQVDFTCGTGRQTRYERLAAEDTQEYYPDWAGRDDAMLTYSSASLAADAELTGHAVLSLWIAASEADAALHAYLAEVEADGSVRYVTEGMLRALHRAEADPPAEYRAAWSWRSYSRAAAEKLEPGEPALLRFALFPTSWTFRAGSRIRLAIAGADVDHFGQVPHGRPPLLTIYRGGDRCSRLVLPCRRVA
jgi:uncharacterized protein